MKNKRLLYLITAGMLAVQTVGCGTTTENGSENNSELVSELETESNAGTDTEKETEKESEKETEKESEKESEKETETKPEENSEEKSESESGNVSEENSEQKPMYTYSELNKKMYAKQNISVKDMPNSDGKEVGVIKEKEEVNITGQCKENNWYRINFNGNTGYVNFEFLIDELPSEPEKPVHTCNFATLKTDANNHWYACSCGNTSGKGGHGYDDEYDASCNTCGYTRSVPERPAPPSDEKESIKFTGGTITLPTTGVTIPTLPHFNTAGMQPGSDIWWDGPESAGNAGMNSIYNTCEQFTQKMRELDKGSDVSKFNASRNLIEWSWLGAGMAGDFELYRGTEYYTLTINCSLSDFKNGAGEQLAQYNRDILRVLISFISSDVETVAGAIIEDMIGTEQFDGSWKTVGDCKVMFDYNSSSNGHYVYKIKAK